MSETDNIKEIDRHIQLMQKAREQLKKQLAMHNEKLNTLYEKREALYMAQKAQEWGIALTKDTKITVSQEMADFTVKENPQRINPPARAGDKLSINCVLDDGLGLDDVSGWYLYFPIEMIKRALEESQS